MPKRKHNQKKKKQHKKKKNKGNKPGNKRKQQNKNYQPPPFANNIGKTRTNENKNSVDFTDLSMENGSNAYVGRDIVQIESDRNYPMKKEKYSERENYIICCYLRRLSSSINIPPIVNSLCLLYYLKDKWDVSCMAKRVLVLENNCIKIRGDKKTTTYLMNTISDGLHAWIFRIVRYPGSGVGREYLLNLMSGGPAAAMINIGIWKTKSGKADPHKILFKGDDNGYGYNADFATLSDSPRREYGQYCNEGDVIVMVLDMISLTLGFIHNGKDYGVAFNVENTTYKAAVSVFVGSNVVVQLVDSYSSIWRRA